MTLILFFFIDEVSVHKLLELIEFKGVVKSVKLSQVDRTFKHTNHIFNGFFQHQAENLNHEDPVLDHSHVSELVIHHTQEMDTLHSLACCFGLHFLFVGNISRIRVSIQLVSKLKFGNPVILRYSQPFGKFSPLKVNYWQIITI